jgi:hypothetical protein
MKTSGKELGVLVMIDVLSENLRRIRAWKKSSGYFELNERKIDESFIGKGHTKNMYAPGSFRDDTKYRFIHTVTSEVYEGTMRQIAQLSSRNKWHQGSWCGTQLVQRIGSKRSLLQYLGPC